MNLRAFGLVEITGAAIKTFGQTGTMHLEGGTTWDGAGDLLLHTAEIYNYSTFDVKNDCIIREVDADFPSVFRNENALGGGLGTFTKTAGAGTTTVEARFVNMGELLLNGRLIAFKGTIEQTSNGLTRLDGGTLTVVTATNAPDTFVLNSGVITGSGMIVGNLQNASGEVNLGSSLGTLTIIGDYAQQNNLAKMRLRYDANTSAYDTIIVTGSATLGGKSFIETPSGMPASPTNWTPFGAVGVTGVFNEVTAPFGVFYLTNSFLVAC